MFAFSPRQLQTFKKRYKERHKSQIAFHDKIIGKFKIKFRLLKI